MKRIITILTAAAIVFSANTTVLACGGHGKSVVSTVCTVSDCTLTALHTHNNKTYTAHYYGDSHKYHDYCVIEECTIAGYHAHDNLYCFGHTAADGHDYHGYCGVTNCLLTGYHEHQGEYCFAHTATDGHAHNTARGRHH